VIHFGKREEPDHVKPSRCLAPTSSAHPDAGDSQRRPASGGALPAGEGDFVRLLRVRPSSPESDVDLLVIMRTSLKPTEQAVRICQAIEYYFGLDLIVRTPEMLERRLALGDSFLAEIMSRGKVLYERSDN
jgi:hypothetical protein